MQVFYRESCASTKATQIPPGFLSPVLRISHKSEGSLPREAWHTLKNSTLKRSWQNIQSHPPKATQGTVNSP